MWCTYIYITYYTKLPPKLHQSPSHYQTQIRTKVRQLRRDAIAHAVHKGCTGRRSTEEGRYTGHLPSIGYPLKVASKGEELFLLEGMSFEVVEMVEELENSPFEEGCFIIFSSYWWAKLRYTISWDAKLFITFFTIPTAHISIPTGKIDPFCLEERSES